MFDATSAAPTSPRVLETDEPTGAPDSVMICCSSDVCDSAAILLDRPVITMTFFAGVDLEVSLATSSTMVCRGFADDTELNVILLSAMAVLTS